jgi:hypothetical protein
MIFCSIKDTGTYRTDRDRGTYHTLYDTTVPVLLGTGTLLYLTNSNHHHNTEYFSLNPMPKRKKESSTRSTIPFHRDFVEPDLVQRKGALGIFPCKSLASSSRKSMLVKSAERGQPSLQALAFETKGGGDNLDTTVTTELALSDIDKKELYIPTARSETSFALPKPRDELDWLVQVPEEGQTFDDYLRLLTTRTSGRMKPLANAEGVDVLLLPIVRSYDKNANCSHWPAYGPSLEKLVEYAKVFFDRKVHVLPAAKLQVSNGNESSTTQGKSKKKRRVSSKPGAFAAASKCKFKLSLPGNDGLLQTAVDIAGRMDLSSDRIQLQVMSLLDELSSYRYSRHATTRSEKDFCIMGITMEDLFDGPSDLFCAGMAFGGDKVAIFSFKRYHPLIKMHPLHWHHYGYTDKSDGYSYYEDNDQDPEGLSPHPPTVNSGKLGGQMDAEFLRRSSKLLTHELGHLYGIDHCIHNRCLMMGTGHLIQDFSAPTHLCGVCLRKFQWRLGFDVKMRYKLLSDCFGDMDMEKERKWTKKQYGHLKDL